MRRRPRKGGKYVLPLTLKDPEKTFTTFIYDPGLLTSVGCEERSRVAGEDAPDPPGRERRGCAALSCSN